MQFLQKISSGTWPKFATSKQKHEHYKNIWYKYNERPIVEQVAVFTLMFVRKSWPTGIYENVGAARFTQSVLRFAELSPFKIDLWHLF